MRESEKDWKQDVNRRIRRHARREKEEFYERIAEEAHKVAEKGKISKIYKITKSINGRRRRKKDNIGDKNGMIIQDKGKIPER